MRRSAVAMSPTSSRALAPDVHWESGGRRSDFPTFGPRKGPSEVQGFFSQVAENFRFLRLHAARVLSGRRQGFRARCWDTLGMLRQLGVVQQLGAKAA